MSDEHPSERQDHESEPESPKPKHSVDEDQSLDIAEGDDSISSVVSAGVRSSSVSIASDFLRVGVDILLNVLKNAPNSGKGE